MPMNHYKMVAVVFSVQMMSSINSALAIANSSIATVARQVIAKKPSSSLTAIVDKDYLSAMVAKWAAIITTTAITAIARLSFISRTKLLHHSIGELLALIEMNITE